MNRQKINWKIQWIGLMSMAFFLTGSWIFYHSRYEIERRLLESLLNYASRNSPFQALHIQNASVDRNLMLYAAELHGEMKTQKKIVSWVIHEVRLKTPLTHFLFQRPAALHFSGLKPTGSSTQGISGNLTFKLGREWQLKLEADIEGLALEDLAWLNPENLEGASGRIQGKAALQIQAREENPRLELRLRVEEPGGNLQAHLLEALLPYLPQVNRPETIYNLARKAQLVPYKKADLQIDLPQSDQMKIFLHISVPDYNLELNVRTKVLVEGKDSFLQVAQILGLIQTRTL